MPNSVLVLTGFYKVYFFFLCEYPHRLKKKGISITPPNLLIMCQDTRKQKSRADQSTRPGTVWFGASWWLQGWGCRRTCRWQVGRLR